MYLGSIKQHNVYTAELTRFELAIDIAEQSPLNYMKWSYTPTAKQRSKASTVHPNNQAKKSLSLRSRISNLTSNRGTWRSRLCGYQVKLDIKGNETVDNAAKEAAKSKGTTESIPSTV